jgi:circadian clock protein KaiB
MKKVNLSSSEKVIKKIEKKGKLQKNEKYVLKLYVTGTTPNSMKAIKNIEKICHKYLEGRYDLEIFDIYQQPQLSQGEQIIAAPTLIKKLPVPLRKFIGDLSDVERVLFGLNLEVKQE